MGSTSRLSENADLSYIRQGWYSKLMDNPRCHISQSNVRKSWEDDAHSEMARTRSVSQTSELSGHSAEEATWGRKGKSLGNCEITRIPSVWHFYWSRDTRHLSLPAQQNVILISKPELLLHNQLSTQYNWQYRVMRKVDYFLLMQNFSLKQFCSRVSSSSFEVTTWLQIYIIQI